MGHEFSGYGVIHTKITRPPRRSLYWTKYEILIEKLVQDIQAVIVAAAGQGEGDKYNFPDGNVFTFPTKLSLDM